MSRKALVAYATRLGSTIEVAETVGAVLCQADVFVDVRLAQDVTGLDEYVAVVLGSAIRDGKWLPEAVHFLKRHQKALAVRPLALFVVSMTMAQDTPENRETVLGYLEPVLGDLPDLKPVDIGLFAGEIDAARLGYFARRAVHKLGAPPGDFRDWDTIRNWAARISPLLLSATPGKPPRGASGE
ncbi:MAG: flavodoxin domain-containing protein [Anaerolineae bacterium]|nr:flavodoxin domain-containing protein [Anaerolineae bacterium]